MTMTMDKWNNPGRNTEDQALPCSNQSHQAFSFASKMILFPFGYYCLRRCTPDSAGKAALRRRLHHLRAPQRSPFCPLPRQDGGRRPSFSAAARARARGRSGGELEAARFAMLWRGRRTHVSSWTTRQLPSTCRVALPHWLICEPSPFIWVSLPIVRFLSCRGDAERKLRRVEFSERSCVAGAGRPPSVRVGGAPFA